ncbi:hypothetical protein L484_003293 [Morus notabilis]|uniref:DUF7054 domain-containing protein n=1 Tax=Morus notabilis TaxID=981085 RepID=W9QSD0_9ROSA|nr:uncharacterized protein At4g22758 [Morus notabilis]EXB37423.1 hypothetical protein L484_003293 [Morus notabilis]
MASPKNHRRGHEEKNRRGRLAEKSSSFHGRSPSEPTSQLRRPKTVSDLLPSRSVVVTTSLEQQRPMKLTKLLLNVTIQGSLGAVQVVMTPESTVGDLVAAALCQYVKEGRRPIFPTVEPSRFNLHYSQFSLECLDREEQVVELGSRNFFLCATTMGGGSDSGGGGTAPSSSCATQADKAVTRSGFNWLKFMDFML